MGQFWTPMVGQFSKPIDKSINVKPTTEALAKHAAFFDSQIQSWESLRQDYLLFAQGKKFDENFAKAVELGVLKNRNNQLRNNKRQLNKSTKRT
jgi:hypothetical protein